MTRPDEARLKAAVERWALLKEAETNPDFDWDKYPLPLDQNKNAHDFARAILDHYAPRLADARRIIKEQQYGWSEPHCGLVCRECEAGEFEDCKPHCAIRKFLEETK